ncbi:MAG: hypothetical protein M1831_002081 [Alyxoria varia]|nr:MAG: hypothetical protein M1831_002081 [Alyxoria varia]
MTNRKRKRTIDDASNPADTADNAVPSKPKQQRRKRTRAQKAANRIETMDQVKTDPKISKRRTNVKRPRGELQLAEAFDSKLNFINNHDAETHQLAPAAARTILPINKMSILVQIWLQSLGNLRRANGKIRMVQQYLPSSFKVWYGLPDHDRVNLQFEPVILLDHLAKQHDTLTKRLAELNTAAHSASVDQAKDGLPGTEVVKKMHQTIGLQLQLHADKLRGEQNLITTFHQIPVEEAIGGIEPAHGQIGEQKRPDELRGSPEPAWASPPQNQPHIVYTQYLWTVSDQLGPSHGQSNTIYQAPSPSTFHPSISVLPASTSSHDQHTILGSPLYHNTSMFRQQQRQAPFHSFAALDSEECSPVDNAEITSLEKEIMEGKETGKKHKGKLQSEVAKGIPKEIVEGQESSLEQNGKVKKKSVTKEATKEMAEGEEPRKERKPRTKKGAAKEAVRESVKGAQEAQNMEDKKKKTKPDRVKRPQPDQSYILESEQLASTRQTPQPLLIVCDLNDTLIKRVTRSGTTLTRRPGLDAFLAYVFSHHKFMIWTSARPENLEKCLGNLLTPQQQQECVAAWGRDTLGLSKLQYAEKVQVYKTLETVFKSAQVQKTYPSKSVDLSGRGGGWSVHNTLLVDDSVEKGAAQPYNLVNVDSMGRATDNTLIELIGYLEQVKYCGDVRPYVKTNPFRGGEGWERHISPRLRKDLHDIVREAGNAAPLSDGAGTPPGTSSFMPATTEDPGLSPQSNSGQSNRLRPTAPSFNPMPASSGFAAINAAWQRS